MSESLRAMLPRDKLDTARAKAIVELGYPAATPVLPELLRWMQDINWPVAQVLQPFLAGIGAPLELHLREILGAEDDVWKLWIVTLIIGRSPELTVLMRSDLQSLASAPTAGERAEAVDKAASEILARS
jgi:hypothetical protein